MSDYETHIGRLIPSIETKEEVTKRYFNSLSEDYKKCFNLDTIDGINELFYDVEDHIEINSKMYIIEDNRIYNNDDRFNMKEVSGGILEYDTTYYNGGCGFKEALEEASKNI